MHNISMTQALGVWTELLQAYYGKNGYGGSTAEIYAFRISPDSPSKYMVEGPLSLEWTAEDDREIKASFVALLRYFEKCMECHLLVDDRTLDAWAQLGDHPFNRRAHVTVFKSLEEYQEHCRHCK